MAQTVKCDGLDQMGKSWSELLKRFPEEKRRVLFEVGQELLTQVRQEIGGKGKVAGWQDIHMGSKGGYVAVRARAKEYQTTKSGKRYAVGYVTNAIEGGHRTGGRRPGRKAEGYRYRPGFTRRRCPVSGPIRWCVGSWTRSPSRNWTS